MSTHTRSDPAVDLRQSDHGQPTEDRAQRFGSPAALSRRALLGGLGGTSVACLAGDRPARAQPLVTSQDVSQSDSSPLDRMHPRLRRAFDVRVNAALSLVAGPQVDVPPITDEEYPGRWGRFTKCLPHNDFGDVDPSAYAALLRAVTSGDPGDFERIPMGGVARLTNPQAGLAFDLVGPDSHQLVLPACPLFESAEAASEMAELYWHALARDIPFTEYGADPTIADAAADLSRVSDFRGPKIGGRVTAGTMFRAALPGVLDGPFVSQLLLKDLPIGIRTVDQRIQTTLPVDYLTTYDGWLAVQKGERPRTGSRPAYDPDPRYVRNGRDLAEAMHADWPGQAALYALLMICGGGGGPHGPIVPFDPNNPYLQSRAQAGFVTFDMIQGAYLIATAVTVAMKAAWYQKWFVHRRLRPEEFGGRVHHTVASPIHYPVHPDLVERSTVLSRIEARFGTTLLPQAYPEGAPIHPAYPGGHATWAGATVTMLKAFFDESAVIADPVVPTPDGLSLVPYKAPDATKLTLGGELNKLAWNIAVGRNFAGIHWRTDATEGLKLGEAVAIEILNGLRETYNEEFAGYSFTSFDDRVITV